MVRESSIKNIVVTSKQLAKTSKHSEDQQAVLESCNNCNTAKLDNTARLKQA